MSYDNETFNRNLPSKDKIPTDFYYKSHMFKELQPNSRKVAGKAMQGFKCIQCGVIKITNRNTLKTEYLSGDNVFKIVPACLYNPNQDSDLRKFNQPIPRITENPTLDELLKD